MPTLKLIIKPDNTFLTQIIYEGILLLIQNNMDKATIDLNEVKLPNYAIRKLLENLGKETDITNKQRRVKVFFVGNDLRNDIPAKIIRALGVEIPGKIRIGSVDDLIKILAGNYSKVKDLIDTALAYNIKGGTFYIGSPIKEKVTAPQLFKIDRYVGFTTTDKDITFKQFTVVGDPIWILIGLLGIKSSFVVGYRESYYFLFFSPDEIIDMIASRNAKYVYNMMSLKRLVIKKLEEIIGSNLPSEIIILSLMLDTNIMAELAKNEIDHLFLQLYRVVNEGNTYKIYNTTLLNLYSTPYYLDVLEKITGSSDKSENLLSILNKMVQPNSPLIWSINSMDKKNKDPDADHAFRALMELYRFIVYGDPRGFYGFLRELTNAKTILEGEKNEKYKNRARYYSRRLTEISKTL